MERKEVVAVMVVVVVVVAVIVILVVVVVVVVAAAVAAAASKMNPATDSSIENIYIPRNSIHLTLHSVNTDLKVSASIKV